MQTNHEKTGIGTVAKLLSVLIFTMLLAGFVPGSHLTAKAAASPYYLSIPSDTYTVTVSGGAVTLEVKAEPTRFVTFEIGWTDYSSYTPYTDLAVTEEAGSYKISLPELVAGQYSYPDYYVETTAISDHTAFMLTNEQEGLGFGMHVTTEDFAESKDNGEPLRYQVYRDNLVEEYPALQLSLVDTGNPEYYLSSLDFDDSFSWEYNDEITSFGWWLYGEEYNVTVVSDAEDVSKTVTYNEFYAKHGFINTTDLSTYALKLTTGSTPADVRLYIDDKQYEFDENGRVSLKDFADHKMHKVSMKAVYPDISACQIELIPDQFYTGKAQKPQVTVLDGDKKLKKGTDYTVSYKNNTKIGSADVTITGAGEYKGSSRTFFEILPPEEGQSFTASGYQYKITDAEKNTVSITGATKKTVTSVTIPATAKLGTIKYQVTGIADNAFAGYKKLKKATIGTNVTAIGKKAFYGDSALKTLTIKTTKLKTVGAKAFKGLPVSAKVKVPSAKVKAYTKLLQNGGLSKKAKVTK